MELLQLRYFFDSARYLSISKTAEKYMVPSTSVSVSIKRLEKELGCKLFDRLPNRIVLNENGKKMLESLTVVFGELDRVVSSISDSADDSREIRILVKALRTVITDKIVQYKYKHANTRFKLIADFDEKNYDNYDVIIDTEGADYAGWDSFELCKQRILIYASPKSHLCGNKLKMEQLSGESFANLSLYGNHYQVLQNACHKAGFSPNLVAQVNDSACFMRIISSGVAIGAAGEMYAKVGSTANVIPLDITDFKEYQTVCIYYKKEAAYGNVRRFIDFIHDNIKFD